MSNSKVPWLVWVPPWWSNSLPVSSHWRGHKIELVADAWAYVDGTLVQDEPSRQCGYCGKPATSDGYDGCIGKLPGVANACCGHGVDCDAYVQFDDGRHVSGLEARKRQRELPH